VVLGGVHDGGLGALLIVIRDCADMYCREQGEQVGAGGVLGESECVMEIRAIGLESDIASPNGLYRQ
jgi:hypothetical protein